MKLRESGDSAAARLLTEVTTTTPTRAQRILHKWISPSPIPYTPEEALAIVISQNLTREQYTFLRNSSREKHHDLYPPYYKVLEAKKVFYPEESVVTATKCEVSLQSLLNKTCESIMKMVPRREYKYKSLVLHSKWGFDGSAGYSTYKQTGKDDKVHAEDSLFTTSLVPLRLVDENDGEILWKNPGPASKRLCRPIRLQWLHETDEVSRLERTNIEDQIKKLIPYEDLKGTINFKLSLTMVDGKVRTLYF